VEGALAEDRLSPLPASHLSDSRKHDRTSLAPARQPVGEEETRSEGVLDEAGLAGGTIGGLLEDDVSTENIDRILQAFDSTTEQYRRAEVEEALALREEITPRLLGVLDELAAAPEKFSDEHSLLHMYAVALLAYFKEPRAHLPIIKAFSLPPETEYRLWAEMTTELLPLSCTRRAPARWTPSRSWFSTGAPTRWSVVRRWMR